MSGSDPLKIPPAGKDVNNIPEMRAGTLTSQRVIQAARIIILIIKGITIRRGMTVSIKGTMPGTGKTTNIHQFISQPLLMCITVSPNQFIIISTCPPKEATGSITTVTNTIIPIITFTDTTRIMVTI
jgi:hypothetical protein